MNWKILEYDEMLKPFAADIQLRMDNYERKKKELLIKEMEWCNKHARDLTNTANVLYTMYVSGDKFSAREQCLDFKRMEMECKKFMEKRSDNKV